jgi:hypothetical protein
MGKLAGYGATVVVNDLDEGPAGGDVTIDVPESDYVSAQTLICGGGFFG